jgi:hypothetical protein
MLTQIPPLRTSGQFCGRLDFLNGPFLQQDGMVLQPFGSRKDARCLICKFHFQK